MAVAFGKSGYEIHRYVGEWFGTDDQWDLEHWGFNVMCQVFVLLECCTTFDVFCDSCLGTRPEVFLVDALDGFIPSRVAVDGSLMPYVHQFTFQSLIWWNDKASSLDVPPE
jgi:hypothetical protein